MRNARKGLFVLLTMMLLCLCSLALSEEAVELTKKCQYNAKSGRSTFRRCLDGKYTTYWSSGTGENAAVRVTAPKGKTLSAVWFQWYDHPHAVALQVADENGDWVTVAESAGDYLSDCLLLPEGTTAFRFISPSGVKSRMLLAALHIYGEGDLPAAVQRWNPPAEKADLMMVVAHPDDEVLWFGGMLPTYAGQEGRTCQVCMMVPTLPRRRLELLDCLWTCGVRNYPVWGKYSDAFSNSLQKQYQRWKKDGVYQLVTGWIRRFQPEVLVTHDIKGEYGHGAHRVCADAVTHCLSLAEQPEQYPDSAQVYGTWAVPKCYLHLYEEGALVLDWSQPLSAFGGKTGLQVAREAFACHISQQHTDYRVEDSGAKDCRKFGLYRSLVGDDVLKNDLFENLE